MFSDIANRPRDLGFKLFGRTIPFPLDCRTNSDLTEENAMDSVEQSNAPAFLQEIGDEHQDSEDESVGASVRDGLGSSSGSNDGCDEEKRSDGLDNPGNSAASVAPNAAAQSKDIDFQKNGHHGNSKAVQKAEQQSIPCPRCQSRDTKFCYFNNYNISQPRHFCKNCQRYWTAGGSLRNVPVGAGRRKIKQAPSQQQYVLPDGLVVRGDFPDSAQQLLPCPGSSPVGLNRPVNHLLPSQEGSYGVLNSPSSSIVLNFGKDSRVCDTTCATSSNLCRAEALQVTLNRKALSSSESTVDLPSLVDSWSSFGWTTGAPLTSVSGTWHCSSIGSSSSATSLAPNSKTTVANSPQAPVSVNQSTWGRGLWKDVPWSHMENPILEPPSWGWDMPVAPAPAPAAATNPLFRNSTLGKHPREQGESESGRGGLLLVPKTLRISDPVEATQSSTWMAVGLGNGSESTSGGIFRAFHHTAGSKEADDLHVQTWHPNPAAMKRSSTFQESTAILGIDG